MANILVAFMKSLQSLSRSAAVAFCALGLLATGCQTRTSQPANLAPTKAARQDLLPDAAKDRLVAGNARYVSGASLHRDWAQARAETAKGQFPYAVVLSCIDSRTSAEIVFDQGHGDLFSARVAGNVLNDDILGSMEFACKVAGARLIAVVGHTECGAIKGACAGVKLGHLTGLLDRISPAVAEVGGGKPLDLAAHPQLVNTVAEANVRLVMRQIREQSPVLRELLDAGTVGLTGGIYDLRSGQVIFLKN